MLSSFIPSHLLNNNSNSPILMASASLCAGGFLILASRLNIFNSNLSFCILKGSIFPLNNRNNVLPAVLTTSPDAHVDNSLRYSMTDAAILPNKCLSNLLTFIFIFLFSFLCHQPTNFLTMRSYLSLVLGDHSCFSLESTKQSRQMGVCSSSPIPPSSRL